MVTLAPPPPIPRRFTKQFREAQRANQQNQTATISQEEPTTQPNQQVSENEQARQYFIKNYGEVLGGAYYEIYETEKRIKETSDPQERQNLRMSLGFARRTVQRVSQQKKASTPIQAAVGSILPAQAPTFIEGSPVVYGYSSAATQGSVYVTASGKQYSATASQQVLSSSESTQTYSPREYLPQSYIPQNAIFTETKRQVRETPTEQQNFSPEKKDTISTKKTIDIRQIQSGDYIATKQNYSNTLMKNAEPRITPEKVTKRLDKIVGGAGAYLGERAYEIELYGAQARAKNPESFYFSQFTKKGSERMTLTEYSETLKQKAKNLGKEESRIVYRETGANVALAGQYLLPFYGEQRIGLNLYRDVQKGEYVSAGVTIAGGAAFKAGEYLLGKTLFKAGEAFSDTYSVPYGSGFKSLRSEKFLSKEAGQFATNATKTISTIKSGINFTGKTAVAGLLFYEASRPARMIREGYTQSDVRSESEKAGKSFGYLKAGYEYPGAVYEQLKPVIYQAKTVYQLIPVSALEAKDVAKGLTNFPKDVIDAKLYLKKIYAKANTPQGREQLKYFNREVFNKQVFGFNVSPGQKPIRYYPIKGNSEFVFAEYYNPLNPSFYFGIPKRDSLSGYRVGFAVPESFGEAQANVLYARGAKTIEVPSTKGDFLAREGERGVFLIPTIKGKRTKTESEVLNVGKVIQVGKKFYTVEQTLSGKTGLLFGKVFEMPEYAVSKYQARFPNPKTIEKQLSFEKERLKTLESFSKPSTQAEVKRVSELKSQSETYYQKTPIATSYPLSSSPRSTITKSVPSYGTSSTKSFSISSITSSKSDSTRYNPPSYERPSVPSRRSSDSSYSRISYTPEPINSTGSSISSSSSSSSISYQPPSPPRRRPNYYSSPSRLPPSNPPRTPPPSSFSSKVFPQNRISFQPGFSVYFLTGGKRGAKVSEQRYTYADALNIGARGVQNSIKRTFEIVPDGIAPVRNIQGPSEILRPGKKPGTFVEKTIFAINTGLEKGTLRSARNKKSKKVYYGL